MNMTDFMMDMPLYMILNLVGDVQPRPTEQIVNDLLAQVRGLKQ